MFFTFLIRLSLPHCFAKATIVWELETIPAVFGKDVILKCILPQNCCKNKQSRRWLGGSDLHLLTMNGFSIDNAKYSEKFNKENKTSVLLIHDFDVMDINVPYECIYGSSTFVRMLNLTEDKFEYHPSGPYTELYTNINDTNALSFNISTEIVYPRPKCSAAMNGKDISLYMTTTAFLKGLFYVAVITVTIVSTPENCPGLLSITCNIGTYSYIYENNITCKRIETASHEGKESSTMKPTVILAILAAIGLVFVIVCLGFKISRSHHRPQRLNTEEHEKFEIPDQDARQGRLTIEQK